MWSILLQNVDSEPEITVDGAKLGHGEEKVLAIGAKINIGGKAEYQVRQHLKFISCIPVCCGISTKCHARGTQNTAAEHGHAHNLQILSRLFLHVQVLRNVRTHA